ncbi:hypothetical protein SAMN05880582_10840 [Rhizobium sp. RU20A]|nr:hypothetical protein SAMN05880582_10840 [Rhizobium sp. RU20A]
MGTSQSSNGPKGGVPMVPAWTPAPPAEDPPPGDQPPGVPPDTTPDRSPPEQEPNDPAPDKPVVPNVPPPAAPLAPGSRFAGTRRSLGEFAKAGNLSDLRRSLGNYVRTGYGGSRTTTSRFGGTASTASAFGGILERMGQQPAGSPLDPALLAGRTANEVMDAVVEAVRPVDGTQDAEAERTAIKDSLSELLVKYPDADLSSLTPEQREFAIERFTAMDVARRFELDVGKTIIEKAPTATVALSRLKQVRDYIKQTVAASFRKLSAAGKSVNSNRIATVVRDALRDTFQVFEGYAE